MASHDPVITLGPELDFLREVWAMHHALEKVSKRMERTIGITGPQRLALRLVSRFPGLPAGRLARLLHLHPSTVTGIVKRLVERGFLMRASGAPDRRRTLLRITPQGIDLLAQPQSTVESSVRSALRAMSARQRDAALQALSRVAVSLETSEAEHAAR